MSNRRRWRLPRMLLVMLCSTFGVLAGLALTSPSDAAFQCTEDLQGVDDQPGQKDLTRMCRGLATDIASCSGVDAFAIRWNWDDTGFSGNNTGDACALFDTDGDGNANFALCVTVTGDPAHHRRIRRGEVRGGQRNDQVTDVR